MSHAVCFRLKESSRLEFFWLAPTYDDALHQLLTEHLQNHSSDSGGLKPNWEHKQLMWKWITHSHWNCCLGLLSLSHLMAQIVTHLIRPDDESLSRPKNIMWPWIPALNTLWVTSQLLLNEITNFTVHNICETSLWVKLETVFIRAHWHPLSY